MLKHFDAGVEFIRGVQTACDPIVISSHIYQWKVKGDIFIVRDWDSGQSLTIILVHFL